MLSKLIPPSHRATTKGGRVIQKEKLWFEEDISTEDLKQAYGDQVVIEEGASSASKEEEEGKKEKKKRASESYMSGVSLEK